MLREDVSSRGRNGLKRTEVSLYETVLLEVTEQCGRVDQTTYVKRKRKRINATK